MVSFTKIEKALAQLDEAVAKNSVSELERDGVVQRFEYTIELLWKVAKKVLAENGVQAIAPKEVIVELANIGWINNPEELINFLKLRNITSHAYEENTAQQVFIASKKFASVCRIIVEILKKKSIAQ